MLASQAPARIPLPFAASGTRNAIPTASQIGITPGAASLTDGFPPLTFTPLAAGGVPPSGADFNGIFNLLSANIQWVNAGGSARYDAAFSSSVGGYPKGARLVKSSNDGFWLSTVDGNTSNPDAGGAGWADLAAAFGGRPGRVYTANDWAYLDKPGGLIVQWGVVGASDLAGTTTIPVVFPLAFPVSSNPTVVVSDDSNQLAYLRVVLRTATGFSILATEVDTAIAPHTFPWIAIGY